MIGRGNKGYVHPFRDTGSGFPKGWRDIEILDLPAIQPERDICDQNWPIRTSVGLYAPARIADSAFDFIQKRAAEHRLLRQERVVSGARLDRSACSLRQYPHLGTHLSGCSLTGRIAVILKEYAGKQSQRRAHFSDRPAGFDNGLAGPKHHLVQNKKGALRIMIRNAPLGSHLPGRLSGDAHKSLDRRKIHLAPRK